LRLAEAHLIHGPSLKIHGPVHSFFFDPRRGPTEIRPNNNAEPNSVLSPLGSPSTVATSGGDESTSGTTGRSGRRRSATRRPDAPRMGHDAWTCKLWLLYMAHHGCAPGRRAAAGRHCHVIAHSRKAAGIRLSHSPGLPALSILESPVLMTFPVSTDGLPFLCFFFKSIVFCRLHLYLFEKKKIQRILLMVYEGEPNRH